MFIKRKKYNKLKSKLNKLQFENSVIRLANTTLERERDALAATVAGYMDRERSKSEVVGDRYTRYGAKD